MKHIYKRSLGTFMAWTLTGTAAVALPGMAGAADDSADVLALTQPANYVELGVRAPSTDSAKFGEYNGLGASPGYGIGNFSWQGGNAFASHDGGQGTVRWQLQGADLGSTSRSLGASVADQGRWSLGLSYDQLRHYSTDSYQTPYQGALGGNTFLLSPAFGVIDATDAGAPGTGTQALTAGQLASFQTRDVYTGRRNLGLDANVLLNHQWSLQFGYNRLDQSGGKLIGLSFSPDAAGAGAGEKIATLMNPTRYTTDSFDAALKWNGERGNAQLRYYASLFKDGYRSVTVANPFVDSGGDPSLTGTPPESGSFPLNSYAAAPDNSFQQLELTGGYVFTPRTSVAGGISYGRNTQNAGFIEDPLLTSPLPRAGLGGLVNLSHADLRLTHQATGKFTLTAGFKVNERDNRTPSETYASFVSVAGDAWGSVVNAPVSNRRTQFELAGSYRIDRRQNLRIAYEYESLRRWCNNALANNAQSSDPEAPAGYYTTAACVQVRENRDNRLTASYRARLGDAARFTAGYSYSRRQSQANASYYNPMQVSGEGFQNLGYVPWFDASRNQHLLKAGLNLQATEKLELSLDGRYTQDNYGSLLGVQKGELWAINLDATYAWSEKGSVGAYFTVQQRQRDLLSGAGHTPLDVPADLWTNRLTDQGKTLGLAARRTGLLAGKLALVADFSWSADTAVYETQLANYTDPLCETYGITCGTLPQIRNSVLRARLTADYQLSGQDRLVLGYLYQTLASNDYYYSAYQYGMTDVTVLPTNQRSPGYTVGVASISWVHRFQ